MKELIESMTLEINVVSIHEYTPNLFLNPVPILKLAKQGQKMTENLEVPQTN